MFNRLKKQSPKKLFIMGYNVLRMAVIKLFHPNSFSASFIQNIHPSTEIALGGGKMELAHSVFTRKNVSFRADSGILKIGTSFFNQGCSITAMNKIEIGDDCLFGPNVVIVDHDHDYHCPDVQRGAEYLCKEVIIGNNVVVGSNTVILKGTHIGDNCMIGAGCVVSCDIEPGTLYYEHREPVSKAIKFKEIRNK